MVALAAGGLLSSASAQVYQPGPGLPPVVTTTTTVPSTTTTVPSATSVPSTTVVVGGGTTIPTTSAPTTTVATVVGPGQVGGSASLGGSVTNEICGFLPGSTVQLTLNGTVSVGTTVADPNGCITITIKVLNDKPQLVVDGTQANGICGTNMVVATGPGASGGTFSQSDSVTVNCAAQPTSSSSGLPFTGANVLKLVVAAAVLIMMGALLVIADRRRGRARD